MLFFFKNTINCFSKKYKDCFPSKIPDIFSFNNTRNILSLKLRKTISLGLQEMFFFSKCKQKKIVFFQNKSALDYMLQNVWNKPRVLFMATTHYIPRGVILIGC